MDTIREQWEDLQNELRKDYSSLIEEYFTENENWIEQRTKYDVYAIALSKIFGKDLPRLLPREEMLKIMENFCRFKDDLFFVATRHNRFLVEVGSHDLYVYPYEAIFRRFNV